tara:strand:+ start:992 stop:2338 length:1347 start_codon:yes stop_codon:yes gene_type:complete
MRLLITLLCITFFKGLFFSQNEINLTKTTHSISIDNIADYVQTKVSYSVTNLRVVRNAVGAEWDLTVKGRSFTALPYNTAIGTQLNSSNLAFKATNICLTPDIFINPNVADANNISTQSSALPYEDLGNPYNNINKYYIVGTSAPDDPLISAAAGCAGTLNNDGTGISNPQTHSFNIDIELDLTAFLTGTSYTPGLYTYEVEFELFDDGNAVSVDQELLTIEVDILPILQIKTSGLNELSFDFTDMSKYNSGITHYGATIIEINSNTEWDLLAIGTSSSNENGNPSWDVVTTYSLLPSGSSLLPLSALELYQTPANPKGTAAVDDYSAAFVNPPTGNNNIEVATTGTFIPVAVPTANPVGSNINKAIAGRFNSAGAAAGNAIEAGSYLVSAGGGGGWDNNDFRYVMSYKITPGLDATFSNGLPAIAAGNYVNPGAYNMQVKYLLTTDQ